MDDLDILPPSLTPKPAENDENLKPSQSTNDRIKERLKKLGKIRTLNVTTKPRNEEIVLEEPPEIKKEEVGIDEATKWVMKKIHLKEAPVIPSKSPKTPRSKNQAFKKNLEERMRLRRKEEQEERFFIYNADNEIADDEEEIADDDFVDSDKEDEKMSVPESKKPKTVINEEEEIIEDVNDSEAEDEEDEVVSDEEDLDGSEEEEENEKNPFIDDEASDDPDDDEEAEVEPKEMKGKPTPSRIIISDDDDEEDEHKLPEVDSLTSKEATKSPPAATQLSFPNCLTQRLEPWKDGNQTPIKSDYSQRSIELDTQAEKEELIMLCSGSFGTQQSDQTLCSKFEKYDFRDFLSDSSQVLPDSQGLPTVDSIDKSESQTETQRRIQKIYDDFNNAEETIDADFSDSEDETPRKRKNVIYSDDDDEEVVKPRQTKQPKLFDSEDENDIEEDSFDVSNLSLQQNKVPQTAPTTDFSDIFTTEDVSNHARSIEDAQEDEDMEEKDVGNLDSEDEEEDNLLPSKLLNKFVDDEASLSGDDVGSDLDEEADEALDDYELDEADKEKFDEEEVRSGLIKQFMKQVKDDDESRLFKIQQQLFADGDLHGMGGSMDRSFRTRFNKDISDDDWLKLVKKNPALKNFLNESDSEEEEDGKHAASKETSISLKKWKDQTSTAASEEDRKDRMNLIDNLDGSSLFAKGRKAIQKKSNVTTKRTTVLTSRDSLLHKHDSLDVFIKENVVETTTKTTTLFTEMKRN